MTHDSESPAAPAAAAAARPPGPPPARHGGARPPVDATSAFGTHRRGPLAALLWRLATARALPRRWRRHVRKRWARRHAPGPFDLEVEGLRVRLYPAENHCDRTMVGRRRLPEAPERALIAPFIAPGMVFVDIGANVGVYSLFVAARAGPSATVLALEPHPRTFAKLIVNRDLNGFAAIRCVNAGAGPRAGETTLHADGGGNIGNASVLEAVGGTGEAVTIRLEPLARLVADCALTRIDLMKIDVEGYEDRALLPFLAAAERRVWPRRLLVETVHRRLWRRDAVDAACAMGYRIAAETGENVLLELGKDSNEP